MINMYVYPEKIETTLIIKYQNILVNMMILFYQIYNYKKICHL
jgi:hypothetical protein